MLFQSALGALLVQHSFHAEAQPSGGLLTPSLLRASVDKSRFVETRRIIQRETHYCPLSLLYLQHLVFWVNSQNAVSRERQWYTLCIRICIDLWIRLHTHMFLSVTQWTSKPILHLPATLTSKIRLCLAQKAQLHSAVKLISNTWHQIEWFLSSYLFHGCVWNSVAAKVEIIQAGVEGSEERLVGPWDCGLEGGKHVHQLSTYVLLEISLWEVGLDQEGHCCGVTLLYHVLKMEENTLWSPRRLWGQTSYCPIPVPAQNQ